MFFPFTSPRLAKKLLKLDRLKLSVMVQLITGHNFLNRHNAIVELGEADPEMSACRFCHQDEESSFHILAECDMFTRLRRDIFLQDKLEASDLANSKTSVLNYIKFLKKTEIPEFLDIINYDPLPELDT